MLAKLRHPIPARTAALIGADALILLCVLAELHLQAFGYTLDQATNSAVSDGHRLAGSAITVIVGAIGLSPMVFNRWDFTWDHRSWSLRGIVGVALIFILSATLLWGPFHRPAWQALAISGGGEDSSL